LILKDKARQFNEDPEIQGLLSGIQQRDESLERIVATYSNGNVEALQAIDFQPDKIAEKGHSYEKLDQLTVELLLGVR
jgi:xylose isomerase